VVVLDEGKAAQLQARFNGTPEILHGVEGLIRLATHPEVDVVVVGTAGSEVLLPLVRAIEAGKRIALASKELLVMAGELIMRKVSEHKTPLIPVDSEHAALFQCLHGIPREQVTGIILTGSGGPLWSLDPAALSTVTPEQVLRHPKWQMGPKITVDSATLMNKGLEVIEARWLFDMPLERIRVLIHPQALIHAIVELVDGSCLAQMSICDMRLPIQYALSVPERWPTSLPRVRWTELSGLQFFEPDLARFPCLRLALEAARRGGTACTVLSAANEMAVWAYLRGELAFAEIPHVVTELLEQHEPIARPTLEQILAVDAWTRQHAEILLRKISTPVTAT
jgi:1-deoxy-D-xylulose-5-phosphate reductoisomerase